MSHTKPSQPGMNPIERIARLSAIALGTFAAWLAGFGLLLWLIGRLASDRYHWSQYLLWIPTPIAFGLVLLGLLAALRTGRNSRQQRWRRIRWGIVLVAIMVYFGFIEHRFHRMAPEGQEGIHIIHWNAWPEENEPTDGFLDGVLALDPDILILTDAWIFPWWRQSRQWVQEHEGVTRSMSPFSVISRLPLITARHLVSKDEIVIALFEFDTTEQLGRTLTVYAVDTPSDLKLSRMELAREARRLLDEAQQPNSEKPTDDQPPRADDPEPPADVVIGDFNITRNSAAMRAMFPDMRHAYDEAGYGYGATFFRIFPLYHIDHTLLGESVRAVRYDLIDPGVSRHRVQSVRIVPRERPATP